MAWNDFWSGTPQQITQAPTISTQAQDTLNQILLQGAGQIKQNPGSFAPIAQKYRTEFKQKTVPTLLERFNSLAGGTHSSKPSGSLAGVISSAGENLNEGLAALEAQYNQRQQELGQGLLRLGLTPSFENIVTPAQPGAQHSILPVFGDVAGQLAVHGGKTLIDKYAGANKPGTAVTPASQAQAAQTGNTLSDAAKAAVGGASAAASIAAALPATAALSFWPLAGILGAGALVGAGAVWLYKDWNKIWNAVRGKGYVEDAIKDAPPEIAQKIRENPDKLNLFFNDPATPANPPEAIKNLAQQGENAGANILQDQQAAQQQPNNGLDTLMQNQTPVQSRPITQPQPQAPGQQPIARPQNQKPKVVCKNGKCKIRR